MQDNSTFMMEWLRRRGITESVATEFGIHWGKSPVMGECIVIPVKNIDGDFLFHKYRRDPRVDQKPKYTYDVGAKVSLYGAHKAKGSGPVIITEGEMDTLVCVSANLQSVTSTGGSASFQDGWKEFFDGREVVIAYDNDDAGAKGAVKTLGIIPWAKVLFVPQMPGVKDISDYVAHGGDLHELLKTARHYQSIEDVKEDKVQRSAMWLPTIFHQEYIDKYTEVVYANMRTISKGTQDKRERCKAVLISNFIKFNNRKAICLWHNEKSPSMQYYPKTNTVYCFGCGKHGDVIDVVRMLYSCSFPDAITMLCAYENIPV